MDDSLKIYKGTFPELSLVTISALLISLIIAEIVTEDMFGLTLYLLIFAVFFLILFLFTLGTLSVINSRVKSTFGKGIIFGSVVHGFMLLFPFAVLLYLSDVLLKWNSFQTIAVTSVITSVSYSIYDLVKLGGSKIANTIMSLIISVLFILFFYLIVSYKIFS